MTKPATADEGDDVMHVMVCIPALRAHTIDTAIASIQRQTWSDWKLLIIGQGTNDGNVREAVGQWASRDTRIEYLHIDEYGLSRARNAGVMHAAAEVYAFTDDDCEVAPDWLERIVHHFEDDETLGVVCGPLLRPRATQRTPIAVCPSVPPCDALYDPMASNHEAPVGWDIIGANIALRRWAIERVGLFDVSLGAGAPFPSGEDLDYKLRLEDAGIRMLMDSHVIVTHTFGYRYGVRAVFRHIRAYAIGMGALAAKLTLQGDKRGEEWRHGIVQQTTWDNLTPGRILRLPHNAVRLWYFLEGYRRCLKYYHYDTGSHAIQPAHALPQGWLRFLHI